MRAKDTIKIAVDTTTVDVRWLFLKVDARALLKGGREGESYDTHFKKEFSPSWLLDMRAKDTITMAVDTTTVDVKTALLKGGREGSS